MGNRLGKFLGYGVIVGLGMLVASTNIGPSGRVPIVPEVRKVADAYSKEELAQIKEFKDETYCAMLSRVNGGIPYFKKLACGTLEMYSKMSRRVRIEVDGSVKDMEVYLRDAVGVEVADDYSRRICEMWGDTH